MSLQQAQLESLKKWLTETEDRIANMSQVIWELLCNNVLIPMEINISKRVIDVKC